MFARAKRDVLGLKIHHLIFCFVLIGLNFDIQAGYKEIYINMICKTFLNP